MIELGLCATCVHAKRLKTKGDSILVLCDLSRTDPRFEKMLAKIGLH